MNNTPLNWNNETKFIPAKPPEKVMSINDHLNNAERELRNALKVSTDTSKGYELKRITEVITTVESIKRRMEPELTFENTKYKDGFFVNETYPQESSYLYPGSQDFWEEDHISITGNPGAMGDDHITLFG
jgi:hypothetical protein